MSAVIYEEAFKYGAKNSCDCNMLAERTSAVPYCTLLVRHTADALAVYLSLWAVE